MNDRVLESKLSSGSGMLASPSGPSLGPKLKAAREAMNWSVEQVAEQLKWSPRQVTALETDNYQVLHGMATVRGFVRAYAKLVKLDPAPLLATLGNEKVAPDDLLPVRRELATPLSKVRLPSMHKRGLSPHTWGLIAAVVLVLGVVVAGQMGWLKPLPPDLLKRASVSAVLASAGVSSPASASSPASVSAPAVVARSPVSTPATEPVVGASPPATPIATPIAAPVKPGNGVNTVANQPAAGNSAAAAPSGTALADASKNVLVLQIRKDSWIEVKRVNGNIMLSRLLKAGETETVSMANPVQVVIGNVAGVEATLRGEPLTLKTGVANTARITLK